MPMTCPACGAWFPGLGSGGVACRRCGADLGAKPGDGGDGGFTYSVDSSSPSGGRHHGGRDDDSAGPDAGSDGGGGDGGGGD